jgi:hypothetical protein
VAGQFVAINPGVDSTDTEIRSAISCWSKYLLSKPNKLNIKDSPFWAESERTKYSNVDQLLNAIDSDETTYSMGYPTIIYAKPKNGLIEIKTLFGRPDNLRSIYVSSIISVLVGKEKEEYKLYNSLTINAQRWNSQKTGSVRFHYSPTHKFDRNKADSLLQSIRDLTKNWGLQPIQIDYYYADTFEEIQHLRGLDYSVGMGNKDKPSGMADLDANIAFAGGLGENYFHEVVHIYLNPLFPKSPLLEGLAVLYGGSLGKKLDWHLRRLDSYLDQHPEIDLTDIEGCWRMDNYTNPSSTIKGLICYLAYEQGGLLKLKQLMSYDDINIALGKEFSVQKEGISQFLRNQIKAHANSN